jgi:short-subunit dehydrogenase
MNTPNGSSSRQFAVVTGASSGIGRELAKQFARNGFDLLITAEDQEIDAAARELQALGSQVKSVRTDLSTEDGVEKLYAEIVSTGRNLDAVAINAGIGVGGDFRETDLRAELQLVDLNCRSTVHFAKRVIPGMTQRGSGRILFTSSIAAVMPDPYEAVYGASKAFVQSFAQALRNELKDTGVTVTALMPGPTETNFFHRADMDDTKVGSSKKDDPEDVARQGYEALMAGKDHIVAGSLKTKTQAAAIGLMPDTAKAQVHRGMAEPDSANSATASQPQPNIV